jgi:hypothetical protein
MNSKGPVIIAVAVLLLSGIPGPDLAEKCCQGVSPFPLSLLGPSTAHSLENPLAVELPKRINASITNILEEQRQSDKKIKDKEIRIQGIVERIELATDEEEIYSLQKQYLALRAENLRLIASKTVKIQTELESIHTNLRKLAEVQKSGERYALGKGIERDETSKHAVGEMFKGFHSVISMIETLDPQANLETTKTSLSILDKKAKQYFKGGNANNIEEQISFIQDAMVVAQSVKGMLGVESTYLLGQLYFVDAKNLIQKFGKLKDAIFAGLDINSLFDGIHADDDKVFTAGGSAVAEMDGRSGRIDTSTWGQY